MVSLWILQMALAEEPAPVTLGYPVRIEGSGGRMVLVDPRGDRVDLGDSLVLVGRADLIPKVKEEKLIRTLAAAGCWTAGGVALVGPTLYQSYTGDYSMDEMTQLAATAGGAALIGGGFVAMFAGRRKELGDWVQLADVGPAVEQHNARFAALPAPPANPGLAPPVVVPLASTNFAFHLDSDGRVRDARNRLVDVPALARATRDEQLAEEFAAGRRMDKAIYITALGVGGAGVVVGAGTVFVGFFDWAFIDSNEGGQIMLAGLGIGAAGGLAAAGGGVGLGVSKHMREDPRRWFTQDELQQKIDAYNAGLAAPPPPAPVETTPIRFEVHPLVSPGMLGVTGTF